MNLKLFMPIREVGLSLHQFSWNQRTLNYIMFGNLAPHFSQSYVMETMDVDLFTHSRKLQLLLHRFPRNSQSQNKSAWTMPASNFIHIRWKILKIHANLIYAILLCANFPETQIRDTTFVMNSCQFHKYQTNVKALVIQMHSSAMYYSIT